jgi:hypothetical protein
MAQIRDSRELQLTVEQRQALEETIAAAVAVQVYRQLQQVPGAEELAESSGGNIAGNCCSCSRTQQ